MSLPQYSTGISDHFGNGDCATTAAGRALGSVGPDVLLFHRLHYSVDRWWSPVVQCGADRLPATENDQ